jgi:predicted RNA-binding protein with PUA-like domain
MLDVQVHRKTRNFTLPQLRADVELAELQVLKKGNRLSITPVEERHWLHILHTLHVRDFRVVGMTPTT